MATARDLLAQRQGAVWLHCPGGADFWRLLAAKQSALATAATPPIVLLAEREPVAFLAGFWAACAAGCPLVLGNPDWAIAEWQPILTTCQPTVIWGAVPLRQRTTSSLPNPGLASLLANVPLPAAPILIATGGSTGQLRFAVHTWDTLRDSVAGFQRYFGGSAVNACCVLPLFHVSGLMQALRCLLSGGTLTVHPFKALLNGDLPPLDPTTAFLSLVPTQLQRLLQADAPVVHWLTQFRTVLLGGAPAWDSLLTEARARGLALAPTYGMTETASQIATLRPAAFLAGATGCGTVLPHAQVHVLDASGRTVPVGAVGAIAIAADSLAHGYVTVSDTGGTWQQLDPPFRTHDLGWLDAAGQLHIVGRERDTIITGGEKVYPAAVEAAVRATGAVQDVAVIGVPDRDWGEVVTAFYVPRHPDLQPAHLAAKLRDQLSRYKHPKRWIPLPELPRNAQGKVNRAVLQTLAATQPPG